MTDSLAATIIQKRRLHVHGGPAPNGGMSWVVATANVGPWRGTGPTLAAAVEDMLTQERVDEAMKGLL